MAESFLWGVMTSARMMRPEMTRAAMIEMRSAEGDSSKVRQAKSAATTVLMRMKRHRRTSWIMVGACWGGVFAWG